MKAYASQSDEIAILKGLLPPASNGVCDPSPGSPALPLQTELCPRNALRLLEVTARALTSNECRVPDELDASINVLTGL